MSLEITKNAELILRLPLTFPKKNIPDLITRKHSWITAHLTRQQSILNTNHHTGKIWYLGQAFALTKSNSSRQPQLLADRLQVPALPNHILQKVLEHWFISQSFIYFQIRTRYWAEKMQVQYKSVRLSHAGTRWGSCTAQNHLRFSWKLLAAPTAIIDYVIIHELAHTTHKHHQKTFWQKVELTCPNWQTCRSWLAHNSALLTDNIKMSLPK